MNKVTSNIPISNFETTYSCIPMGEFDPICEKSTQEQAGVRERKMEFKDVVDAVNPLQHLPLVSSIYRNISEDEIGIVPKFLGGALYGGPVGLIMALGSYIATSDFVSTKNEQPQIKAHNKKKEEYRGQSQDLTPKHIESLQNSGKETVYNNNRASLFKGISIQKHFPLHPSSKGKVFQLEPLHGALGERPQTFNPNKTLAPDSVSISDKYTPKKGKLGFTPPISGTSHNAITSPIENSQIEQWMLQTLGKYEKLHLR